MPSISDPLSEVIDLGNFLLDAVGSKGGKTGELLCAELDVRDQSADFFAALSYINARFEKVLNIIKSSEKFKDSQKAALLAIIQQGKAVFSTQYINHELRQIIPQFFKQPDLAFLDLASNSIREEHPINIPSETEIREMLDNLDEAILNLNDTNDPFLSYLQKSLVIIRKMIAHQKLYGFDNTFKQLIDAIAALRFAEQNASGENLRNKMKKAGIALALVFSILTTAHEGIEMIGDYSDWLQKGYEQLQPYIERKMLPPPTQSEVSSEDVESQDN